MYKTLLLLTVSLFLISCSLTEPRALRPNEKAFEQEDNYIMLALQSEQIKDYQTASEIFKALYEKSSKKEYMYRSLQNDLLAKDYEKLIKRVDELLIDSKNDVKLTRLKIVVLFDLNRLDEAIRLATLLAAETLEPQDYLLASDVLIKREEYDLAVKYLESAYAKENNERILDKMSIILYVNLDRKKEAIAHLETHSRMLGCSKQICSRLISFYGNENNIEGMLSTYLRLYEVNKDDKVSQKITQIYTYKQEYSKLMDFLEKSKSDDKTLLQLYATSKSYKKAYVLSSELYDKTLDIDYLGQSAIYEYENAKNKNSKKLLSRVISKLEKVTTEDNLPLYLNYLGYILIDHEVDVKKGMKYIDKVLLVQPNSAFYLDSLAWGYYKLGNCSKAKSVMDKVVTLEGGADDEVLFHVKKINKCLKNKKVKKQK